MRNPRRTKRDSTFRHYHLSHEAEVVRARRGAHPADDLHERSARAALRRLRASSFSYFAHLALAPMLVIIVLIAVVQYWTSDKLALAASGAKIVSREEAPDLHAIVERLCAMADLPKPRIAVIPTDVPNAFATGRSPKHAAIAVTNGPLEAARAAGSRGGARPRALAHREPRRADHDRGELLRDARRADHALGPLLRHVRRLRRRRGTGTTTTAATSCRCG